AMVTWNLREQAERPVLDYAADHGKGILVKKALASGHICLEGEDPLTAGFELVFSHPAVSSAIIGTINPLQWRQKVTTVAGSLERRTAGSTACPLRGHCAAVPAAAPAEAA